MPDAVRDAAERELTRKQLDVLKLWLAGAGTARIAIMLGISESTARGHKTRALQKMKSYLEGANMDKIDISDSVAEICHKAGVDKANVQGIHLTPTALRMEVFRLNENGSKYIQDDGNVALETLDFAVTT